MRQSKKLNFMLTGIKAIHRAGIQKVISSDSLFQLDPNRCMVTGFFPAPHFTVNPCMLQTGNQRRTQ